MKKKTIHRKPASGVVTIKATAEAVKDPALWPEDTLPPREKFDKETIAEQVSTAYGKTPGQEKITEDLWNRLEFDTPYARYYNLERLGVPGKFTILREWIWPERFDVLERCHLSWERNPLARAGVEWTNHFVIGSGGQISYRSRAVEDVLQDFREEPVNDIEGIEREFCTALQIDGEVIIRYYKNTQGRTVIVPLRPWHIHWINTAEGNYKQPTSYHYVYTIYRSAPGQTDFGIEDIPVGDLLHVAINKLPYELRGRPDIFAILPWLKAYRDWLEERARLNRRKTIYYVLTVKNASAAQVSKIQADFATPPPPGSILVVNENMALTSVESHINAEQVVEDGRQIKLMAESGMLMPEFYFCYSDDTEVLTSTGWKRHDQVTVKDAVMGYDAARNVLQWDFPKKVNAFPYRGDMVQIKSKRLNMLVTPNHKMLVRLPRKQDWRDIQAEDLLNIHQCHVRATAEPSEGDIEEFCLPAVRYDNKYGKNTYPRQVIPMDLWIQFIGWFVTEGWLSSNDGRYRVAIGQKGKYVPEIDRVLRQIGFNFNSSSNSSSGITSWEVSNKQLFDWLEENIGKGAANKHLPTFAISLSRRQSKLLFDTMMKGDGGWLPFMTGKNGAYGSVSPMLANDFQILAMRAGYGAIIRDSTTPYYKNGFWQVSINDQHEPCIKRNHVSLVPYDGMVYCLTMPSGYYVTRRNGRIAIQGNSDAAQSTLASATAQALPVLKKFDNYQHILARRVWIPIYRRVILNAIEAGRIDEMVDEIDENGKPTGRKIRAIDAFSYEYPEIKEKDPKNLAEALQIAVQQFGVSEKTAQIKMGFNPQQEKQRVELQGQPPAPASAAETPGATPPKKSKGKLPGSKRTVLPIYPDTPMGTSADRVLMPSQAAPEYTGNEPPSGGAG